MNRHHIESTINNMLEEINYIKISIYSENKKRY